MIEHRPDRASPWRARVRAPDGRLVSKSFRRKIDAEAWEAAQKTDIRRGEWTDPRAGNITLTEWLHSIPKLNVSERWRKARLSLIRRHVEPTIGRWPLNRLTPEAIQQWVSELSDTLAPATVRKLHTIVGEGLRLAVARGRLLRSPDIEIELPRMNDPEHRYLTESQLNSLAAEIEPRYRPFVLLGGYAGLRPGEALRAEWGDLSGRTLQVRGTKTKGSRRNVRIPPILSQALAEHKQAYSHVRLILHNTRGKPADEGWLRRQPFARAVAKTVGEPMRPYDLRHTHVALLIEQGAHPKIIADRLGHSSIRVTMDTYGHLLEGVESDVVDRLGSPQKHPKGNAKGAR